MGTAYERELKGILSGDEKVIEKCIKTCSLEDRESYRSTIEKPFIVIRAAGSFGVDLVAIRGDYSFPIEEKASVHDVLHFSHKPRLHEQAEKLREMCQRAGLFPLYAFRLKGAKGDSWRVFTLEIEGLEGRLALLYKRIPQVSKTKSGNLVLRWEEGMPLSQFLSYMSS
ncbi:MAG: Holliday junction resolvase [Candidatus Thermoplasmatota archaeon]|nr:Holliday junction resolvase [Candidatus Thermoplasmatota archaeon]